LKDTFCLTDPESVKRKNAVAVFDDIVTTGASVRACVDLLNAAGAKYVYSVCIAYTI
jgi:predicted amidophosphoribosyltransferase